MDFNNFLSIAVIFALLFIIVFSGAMIYTMHGFQKVINEENERGGEEAGERAVQRFQKKLTSIRFMSIFAIVAVPIGLAFYFILTSK